MYQGKMSTRFRGENTLHGNAVVRSWQSTPSSTWMQSHLASCCMEDEQASVYSGGRPKPGSLKKSPTAAVIALIESGVSQGSGVTSDGYLFSRQ